MLVFTEVNLTAELQGVVVDQSWSTRTVIEQQTVDEAFDLKDQGLLVLDGFDNALARGGAGGEETCEDPDK